MEQLQEFWPQYLISNSIALVVLLLAWTKPAAARVTMSVIFLAAWAANTYVAVTDPADYLNYAQFVVLDAYRNFIHGWFADHTRGAVLSIAAGQFCIGLGMLVGGRLLKPAVVGIVVFGLAIAPFGIGSAFPCSVLLACAAIVLWRRPGPAGERK